MTQFSFANIEYMVLMFKWELQMLIIVLAWTFI